jgi:hypothetical protein
MPIPVEDERYRALQALAAKRFGKITPTEDGILQTSASTTNSTPGENKDRATARSQFLRWLLTEKDVLPHIDPLGLRVDNVTLKDELDLQSCTIPFPLRFDHCTFAAQLILYMAEIPSLFILGCETLRSVDAFGMRTMGSLRFWGLKSSALLRFDGAQIGGDVDFSGASLESGETAISAKNARIGQDVVFETLNRFNIAFTEFQSKGAISLKDAQIGGSIRCSDARISGSPYAFSAEGARISGAIDLSRASFEGPINLDDIQSGADLDCTRAQMKTNKQRSLSAVGARVGGSILFSNVSSEAEINLSNCQVRGALKCESSTLTSRSSALTAKEARITLDADFSEGTSMGEIDLSNANIGGDLDFSGTKMLAEDTALDLSECQVGGDLQFDRGSYLVDFRSFLAAGSVKLDRAKINGDVLLNAAELSGKNVALAADGVEIGGNLLIGGDPERNEKLVSKSRMDLVGAKIGRNLVCGKADLAGTPDPSFLGTDISLNMAQSKIEGAVVIGPGLISSAALIFVRAEIGTGLQMGEAQLKSPIAFLAMEAVFNNDVLIVPSSNSRGQFGIDAAHIRGNLVCAGTKEVALSADGVKVSESVSFATSSFLSIRIRNAEIGGSLTCSQTKILDAGQAFDAEHIKVAGSLSLSKVSTRGQIVLRGAEIGGDLNCGGAHLDANGDALIADSAKIKGNVLVSDDFSSVGTIRFVDGQIGGNVDCIGASLSELNLERAHISGDLHWLGLDPSNVAKAAGPDRLKGTDTSLRLTGTSVTTLHDIRPSWPACGRLHLQDFVYSGLVLHEDQRDKSRIGTNDLIHLNDLPLTARDRLQWLLRQPEGDLDKAQPWHQLSKLLESNGDPEGSKEVLYEYRERLAKRGNFAQRLASFAIDSLVEQPLRVTYPIVALGLVGSFVFWRASRMRAMVPRDKDVRSDLMEKQLPLASGYPPFNPIVYALENVLPGVKLGQDDAWVPDDRATPQNWLPHLPNWFVTWVSRSKLTRWLVHADPASLADRWRITRWLFLLNYTRLAILRWTLIILGWVLVGILTYAIGERIKQ